MAKQQQTEFVKISLDELFKKIFPGLTHLIEKIQIAKTEPMNLKKTPPKSKP